MSTKKPIGIFYGSSTGNCENVAHLIQKNLEPHESLVYDVSNTNISKVDNFDTLILGISTWGIGDLQDDFNEFVNDLKRLDLSNKKIALFGLGDQLTYSESFADGLGKLYNIIAEKDAEFFGFWKNSGYTFNKSQALLNGKFVGLVIDEDAQPELTILRVEQWVKQIKAELGLND